MRQPRALLLATAAALSLAAAVAPATGCLPHACTLIGWNEGLTVELAPGFDDLPDGTYTFTVDADGAAVTRTIDVVAGQLACVDPDGACGVQRELAPGRWLHLQVDFDGLLVWYVDDGELAGGPQEATVRVDRDGASLATATFTPTYTATEPNGDGCGVATQATVKLSLPGGP